MLFQGIRGIKATTEKTGKEAAGLGNTEPQVTPLLPDIAAILDAAR
jgi:hypothetical protein